MYIFHSALHVYTRLALSLTYLSFCSWNLLGGMACGVESNRTLHESATASIERMEDEAWQRFLMYRIYACIVTWWQDVLCSSQLSIYLCIFPSIYLYIYPPTDLSIYPSIYPSFCLCIYPSICLSMFYLSIYLSIYLPTYLSIYPSFFLSSYLSVYVST